MNSPVFDSFLTTNSFTFTLRHFSKYFVILFYIVSIYCMICIMLCFCNFVHCP